MISSSESLILTEYSFSVLKLTYLKIEVARVKIHEGSGSYATVLMDTQDNEYADALQSLVDDKEGVGMKNKQVQVYEPNKVV
ncbi:hypothetical protein HRED_02860 [Candidatus Haloredivivus sp. G17]|nr:hypothetical protein HRED_02860 [Candidatus Haloredivivus sp. G17]